ncbi:MAG: BatA domain-containing protein [Bacteroidota bacterium]
MTFLNPALLLGLLAAAVPIVIHFLNLRKLKTIEFSTLAFLKELQKTKIRRIKLKQWLLLLLRVLIIVFLVLAFARPTLKTITLGDSSSAKTTAVIILDNTFSMSLVGEKGSLLNNFKHIAKNLLYNFQPGDEIALVTFSNIKQAVPSNNFVQVKKEIEETEITRFSGTINEAMIKASQILFASKNFNKEIYLLSDLQKSRITNSDSEISQIGKALSPDTRLYIWENNSSDAANLGIEELKPNNQIYEQGKELSFSALLKNYSNISVNENVVSFFVNGKRSAQKNISLAAGESKEVTFETTLQDSGLVEFSAELEDDALLQDNKRYFSIFIPSQISLLLLYDKADDSKFVKFALGIPNSRISLSEMRLDQAASAKLNKTDVLFLIGSEGLRNENVFSDYLYQGGKIIAMPGSQSSLIGFQNLCRSLLIAVPAAVAGKPGSPDSFTQFSKTDFQHPLLKNIFEEKSKAQIESPEIFCYFKNSNSTNGRNIITLIDNSSFLSEHKVGNGKVLLFNSAPVLSWNTFPLKAFFSPLLTKALLYGSVKADNDSTIVSGEEAITYISSALSQQLKVNSPSGVDEYFDIDSLSNKKYLPYKNTSEAGTYKIYSNNTLVNYFSVNHDSRESVLEFTTESEFAEYLSKIGYEGKLVSLSGDTDYLKEIYQSRFGTELWKYFLLIVLMLAIAESLLARSTKKDTAL